MSCNVRTVTASERLYRAEVAHNTTQAAGAVWCMDVPCCQPLGERRHRYSVFEEVFFADGNSILDKERTVFFGKTDSTVMLLLSGYIPCYHFAVAHTVCKSRVLFGPSVKGREMRVGFQPFACSHLEILHELGHGQCGRKRDENMHVVWHTADTIQLPSDIVDEAKDIRIEFTLVFDTDSALTPMSAKNNMVQSLCITHTDVTMYCAKYCSSSTLSPVSDRHIESCGHSHRTTPSACTVLSAPFGAFSVSDTGCCAVHRSSHRTAPVSAFSVSDTCSCTVHRSLHRTAPVSAFSVSDTLAEPNNISSVDTLAIAKRKPRRGGTAPEARITPHKPQAQCGVWMHPTASLSERGDITTKFYSLKKIEL